MGAEMMRICLQKRAGNETALHTLVAAMWGRLSMGAAVRLHQLRLACINGLDVG
jgi:hypothetical protein